MTAVVDQQWTCAKCAKTNEPWRQFCGQCGVQQPQDYGPVLANTAGAPGRRSPSAPTTKRRRWAKVAGVGAIVLVAAGGAGFGYLRQTDPAAARDRDLAEAALPTPGALGPEWSIDDEHSYTATRGGLRLEDDPSDPTDVCLGEEDDPTVTQGTGGASRALMSDLAYINVDVMMVEEPAAAADTLVATATPAFTTCMAEAARAGVLEGELDGATFTVATTPLPPPGVGEGGHAVRMGGQLTAPDQPTPLDLVFDVAYLRQGRAVVVGTFMAAGAPVAPELQHKVLQDVVAGLQVQE